MSEWPKDQVMQMYTQGDADAHSAEYNVSLYDCVA